MRTTNMTLTVRASHESPFELEYAEMVGAIHELPLPGPDMLGQQVSTTPISTQDGMNTGDL